jgi:hypothetical protein
MSRRRNGRQSKCGSYPQKQLRQTISELLPGKGLPILPKNVRQRWTLRLLVMCAILVAWQPAIPLKDRFAEARWQVMQMHPGRRGVGRTYQGFIAALVKVSQAVLTLVVASLQQAVRELAGESCWCVAGWCVFGVDGSKIDCPMTAANEEAFGIGGRTKSGPQQLLTLIFHVGTGLPWSYVRGKATDSERSHLLQMLDTLPRKAMLLADAGFTGYELLEQVTDSGRPFLIRIGANVRLLKKLGYAREYDGTVYLWPDRKQKKKQRPLVLRLIKAGDGRKTIHLLTSVRDQRKLSDLVAAKLYKRRWGVELLYRSLKQTLGRRKMLSDSPEHAKVELDWTVIGFWVLTLINGRVAGVGGGRPSPASALSVIRRAAAGRGGALRPKLAAAVQDNYVRTAAKKARHRRDKKKDKPPGRPKARKATAAEVRLAKEIKRYNAAA